MTRVRAIVGAFGQGRLADESTRRTRTKVARVWLLHQTSACIPSPSFAPLLSSCLSLLTLLLPLPLSFLLLIPDVHHDDTWVVFYKRICIWAVWFASLFRMEPLFLSFHRNTSRPLCEGKDSTVLSIESN